MCETKHPAKYSDALLPIMDRMIGKRAPILDPFGGTGKLKQIRPEAVCSEIEYEWAHINGDIVADALHLPFADHTFEVICTSPTYGNRMADHHNAKDNSRRNTYRHTLGKPLHPNNSGQMQWGKTYMEFHVMAWTECKRVLSQNGILILNISNHIRKGQEQYVATWHAHELERMGFKFFELSTVHTPRQRYGKNGDKRVGCELVMKFGLSGV